MSTGYQEAQKRMIQKQAREVIFFILNSTETKLSKG